MESQDYSYSDDEASDYDYDLEMDDDEEADNNVDTSLPIQVIKYDALIDEINLNVQKCTAVLGLSPHLCKVLLHLFSWDRNKLLESFYDSESPQAFFAKQKVDIPKNNANDFSIKQGLCPICYMDVNPLVELSCKHMFCTDCWNSYLLTRFRSEADPYPSCMDLKCHYYLDEDVILKLLQSSEEKKFFSRLLVKSFVDCNPAMKWCPGTDCSKAVKVKAAECRAVTCDCGTTFCFQCSQEWHEPLTCALLNRWVKKYSGDSESMKWVSVNTKDCPKCNAAIEKNGGCNHMVCRLKSCGYEFCWFCMEDWKKHGYSNTGCNRYEESSDVSDKANNFRESLKRYMHYYDRFANHRKSLLAESALMELIALKIEQMQSKSYSWIETQFLRDAVKVLNECRRSLMFAYAFAYYLPDSNTKKIFEHNQNDLEHATEELSGLLERDIDLETEDLVTLKQKVQDKFRYVEKRRQLLIDHCTEGYEKDEWKFNPDE